MKVLFICYANINRSQIAEALFNKRSRKGSAKSAGINPRMAGAYLREENNNPIMPMKKRGHNISGAKIKRINPELVRWADKIVILFQWRKHAKEVPPYVKRFPDKEFWEIGSIPDKTPYEKYCRLEARRIAKIEERVKDLVERIG